MLRDLKANSFFTMLQTWLKGELVGTDEYGNRYYRERRNPGVAQGAALGGVRREADPTRWCRPAGWGGCTSGSRSRRASSRYLRHAGRRSGCRTWTGTAGAYLPPGALERGGQRAPATGDYESGGRSRAGSGDDSASEAGESPLDRRPRDAIAEPAGVGHQALQFASDALIAPAAAAAASARPRATKKSDQGSGSGRVKSSSAAA